MISIILPIFNNEKTIQRTLNSIIKNLTINDELIIINDGSTDSSLSIIKNFIKENKNLETKIISNKKQMGLAFSLNEAISLAEKKYIARIDGDDININNRFEFQLKVMEDNPQIDLLTCPKIDYKTTKDIDKINLKLSKKSIYKLKKISKYILAYKNLIVHPSIMCKTEVIKKFKYNIKFIKSQDYKLWLDMIISGIKIYSCDRAVIIYFNNPVNKIKIKKQLFFSIKARIDYVNLYRPLLSLILLIGSIKDKITIYKLNFFNKNEI